MKRTAITLLLIAVAASAEAQSMYDALRYSENNYEGTARTMAMGNAFTALGGDLGSVNINPAGSAVARYSQVTITPGVAVSVSTAGGTSPDYFSKSYRTPMGRFNLPNIGFSVNFDTNMSYGIKNWSMGFTVNRTNTYQDDMFTKGLNSTTSFAGAMATFAAGINVNDLILANDGSYDPYYDSGIPFDVILAYESGIISDIYNDRGTEDVSDDWTTGLDYAGVTENYYEKDPSAGTGEIDIENIGLNGNTINQIYSRRITGYKYDYVFNWAANISDVVYIGANLGITSLSYNQEYYIKENSGGDASDYSLFQTQFNSLRYNNLYSATGVGVYGKFGILVTPGNGLRLGAAIQTPTATTIRERWSANASVTTYSDSYGNGDAETPESSYQYELRSPFRFNVGAAYTFGSFAVVSADYEMANYRGMYIHESKTNDNSNFDAVNSSIKERMGVSHMFRAGVEIKPFSSLAVRAGYGLTTSPEKLYNESGSLEYSHQLARKPLTAMTHRFAAGLGYSSSGSFFADLAVQATRYADEYIYPYDYYLLNGNDVVIDYSKNTPEILNRRWLVNILLTVGFRF